MPELDSLQRNLRNYFDVSTQPQPIIHRQKAHNRLVVDVSDKSLDLWNTSALVAVRRIDKQCLVMR